MNLVEFLQELSAKNVELWLDGGKLRYRGPQDVLTPELLNNIKQFKEKIILLLQKRTETAPTIALGPMERNGHIPLSFAQQRMWFLQQLEVNSSFYNLPAAMRFQGQLNAAALEYSINYIINRHEILRTNFIQVDGQPFQVIHPARSLTLTIVDLHSRSVSQGYSLPESQLEIYCQQQVIEETLLPFDLATDPLVRASLFKLTETEHVLLLVMHHIVSDGWSMGVVIREIATVYKAVYNGVPITLQKLPIQYADFAIWQRQWLQGEVLTKQLAYWKEQLADAPALLELPTDRPRPAIQTYRGVTKKFAFSKELSEALMDLSQRQGVTLFMTLFAAFQTLLYRYSGQTDICIGTPIANRNASSCEGLIGLFINTLVLRGNLSGNPSFSDLLLQVRKVALDAYAHQDLPFEQLVEQLQPERSLSYTPLFQVMFVLLNTPMPKLQLPDLTLSQMPIDISTAKFDLTLLLENISDGLIGSVEYNTDLFDAVTISRIVGHYQTLLEAVVVNPLQLLSELPLLTANEQQQILVEWNNTQADYPKQLCLHTLFEQQVQKTPNAVAVVFEDEQLTYNELNALANQLAHYLHSLGVGPEVLVGICTERSTSMVVGLLAILKAGGAYVPLDPIYPPERLAYILSDSGVQVLLTQQSVADRLPDVHGHIVYLDSDWPTHQSSSNPNSNVSAENLAYAIYTSGSTGRPKGVQISHRAVVNFLSTMSAQPGMVSSDVLVAVTTITFDIAALELFLPLSLGARLVLTRDLMSDGGQSIAALGTSCATVMQGTPATWRGLMQVGFLGNPQLKILCGGEALDLELAAQLLERGDSLWNMYGPTETTIWSAVSHVQAGSGSMSIGRAIANTQFYILDANLQPVPVGVAGELHIGGDGLARGYLSRPELTAEKFIPNAFSSLPGEKLYKTGDLVRHLKDGNIEYLGRIDNQVKVRGFRIELPEIEALLSQHPTVQQAVVIAKEIAQDKRLVAYLILQIGATPAIGELRDFLKQQLPEYMVPSYFVVLNALPLTPNGKVDRNALPDPDPEHTKLEVEAYVAPRNELERLISGVWQEVLNTEKVGVNDNFFELGGHSLLIVQVYSKLHQKLLGKINRDILVLDLFKYPTISTLAQYLGQEQDGSASTKQKINHRASKRIEGEPIAIIGMAGRFPGAKNVNEFWQNLRDGVESISFFTDEELKASGIDPELLNDQNYVKANALLTDVEMFDASFFGFTPKEAEIMDPQHRLFLECSWEVLENAGYDSETYNGQIGVYGGAGLNAYLLYNLISNRDKIESVGNYQTFISNDKDFVPTRVSYKLNLTGPSVNVNTACSTSLVAVQMGCQSLLNYQCDMVLAGGVSIGVTQKSGYLYQEGMIFSPDGHCRAFDAQAGGTVSGNGVGIVLLKRLSDAIADGDYIHAVIKGSAINNDGSLKVGYTAPSVEGQAAVISEAQAIAGIEAETITYVEAHGTGTVLGDPIEIAALTQAFRDTTEKKGFCAIGAVKTNVGHLDAAAGVAGLMKTVMALKHKLLPPTLHFEKPNPKIDFVNSPFYVNTTLGEWKTNGTKRRAGVSSFGIGGTNAHVILEEAPTIEPSGKSRPWQLLVLSAKTDSALESATANLVEHLKAHPEINLADVAYTQSIGRRGFEHRRIVVGQDINSVAIALNPLDPKQVLTNFIEAKARPVVFMFSGQGTQYVNMGLELYQTEPTFRREVDLCSEFLLPHLGLDLRHVLYPSSESTEDAAQLLLQTSITQPALFVIEYALAKLWMEWGMRPQAMIGHSIGEYVAATVAGVFSLDDALALVAKRGKLMQQLPQGGMLSVQLPEQEVKPLLTKELSLAASNAPSYCVVSGCLSAVEQLQQQLQEKGVGCRQLHTNHAFHSQMMEPIIEPFTQLLQLVKLNPPQIPFVSNVSGTWITATEATDPNYWARHLRQPVRFNEGIAQLVQIHERILLEVGPGRTLSTFALQHQTEELAVLTSMRHPQEQQSDVAFLLNTLGRMWLCGVQIDWPSFYTHEQRHRIPLPTYPFDRQPYWIKPNPFSAQTTVSQEPLQKKPKIADWFYVPRWKESIPPELSQSGELAGQKLCWLVFVDAYGIGDEIVKRLKQEGQDAISVMMGQQFTELNDHTYAINPQQRDDYNALLQALQNQDLNPNAIAYFWSVTPNDTLLNNKLDELTKSPHQSFEDFQNLGFWSLLFLAQAVGEENITEPIKLMVVTSNIYDVTGDESLCPEKATVLGPCKVIPQEFPNFTCCCIDVVIPYSETPKQQLIDNLLTEFTVQTSENVVAYRGHHRWVQTFEKIHLDDNIAGKTRLRQGGVYLITGGLGGIGLVLAEYLAKTVQAKLILVGRKGLPERSQWSQWLATHDNQDAVSRKLQKVLALEELGTQVQVESADVADPEQMQAVIAQALKQFGQINGVIHAAGIAGGGMVQLKTPDTATSVLAPKVKGTLVLEEVLKNINLDFFVLCSSISSILGDFGQVDYCAANAFLDVYAQRHANKFGQFTVSINWDTWQEVGMTVETAVPNEIKLGYEESLKKGILPQEGAEAFGRILRIKQPQIVVSTKDLQSVIEHNYSFQYRGTELALLEENLATANLSKPTYPRPNLGNNYVAARNEVEQIVAEIWQQVLGIEKIGIHDNFFDLGGNSLISIQVISQIQKELNIKIPLVNLYKSPTVSSLAEILSGDQNQHIRGEESLERGKKRREKKKQRQRISKQ